MHDAGVGAMWVTFMYTEMDENQWHAQTTWMQGYMYTRVSTSTLDSTKSGTAFVTHVKEAVQLSFWAVLFLFIYMIVYVFKIGFAAGS